MRLVINYMLRTVRKSKLKSAIVIFSFSIMAALLLVNLLMLYTGADLYRKSNQLKYGDADIIGHNRNNLLFIDNNDLIFSDKYQFKNIIEVENFVASFENDSKKRRMVLYSADFERFIDMGLVEEKDDKKFSNDDLVLMVSKDFIETYNYKEGDTIELSYADRKCKVEVISIPDNKGLLSQASLYDQAIVSTAVFEELSQMDFKFNSVYYDIENDNVKQDVLEQLNKDNPNYEFSSLINENDEKKAIANLNTILLIVLMIVIILSTIVIWALYNHIFESHISVIGAFRSIGISKIKIGIIMMSETLLYGVSGGVVGALLGCVFYKYLVYLLIGVKDIRVETNVWLIIISFAFPVLYSSVLTVLMLLKIFKRPIINIIRNANSKMVTYKPKKYIILGAIAVVGCLLAVLGEDLLSIFGYLVIIFSIIVVYPLIIVFINKTVGKIIGINNKIGYALGSIAYNKLIIRSITVSMVSLGLIIPVFAAKNSMHDIFYFYENNYNFDVILGINNNNDIDINELKSLSCVEDSMQLFYSNKCKMIFNDSGKEINIGVLGRDVNDDFDEFLQHSIEVDESLLAELKDSENIILDEFFSDKKYAKVGDVVHCKVNEKEYDFTVIGFCDTYRFNSASNTAIIDLKKFKKDISDNVETMYFQTNTTSQELFEQLDDYLMDYSVVLKNVEDFFGKQAQSNDSILKLISDIMYVNLIICFFGIVNNIITDFLNRKKEFAVLISTSMSHTQLIRITNIQMLFVAGYSIIGGLLFSYISTKMLDKIVVYYHLISTGMKYPVMDAIKIFIIAFVLFLIMILVPFCIIKKINIYYYLRRE